MVQKRKSTFAKEKYCNIANCSLFRPSLPAVRITPEPASGGHELVPLLPHGHHLSPCHSPGLLYPGVPTFDQVKLGHSTFVISAVKTLLRFEIV